MCTIGQPPLPPHRHPHPHRRHKLLPRSLGAQSWATCALLSPSPLSPLSLKSVAKRKATFGSVTEHAPGRWWQHASFQNVPVRLPRTQTESRIDQEVVPARCSQAAPNMQQLVVSFCPSSPSASKLCMCLSLNLELLTLASPGFSTILFCPWLVLSYCGPDYNSTGGCYLF